MIPLNEHPQPNTDCKPYFKKIVENIGHILRQAKDFLFVLNIVADQSSSRGIRKKFDGNIILTCRRKGQIWRHCDGKNFRLQFVISGSVPTMQRCIINNFSKKKY